MKLKLNILKLRGTIFTQQINYSPDFVKNISAVLDGFLPSFLTVLPQNNVPNNLVTNFWELINPSTGEHIQFNNIKIDIVKNMDVPFSEQILSTFAEHCSAIFEKIMAVSGQNSSRLAIAPTFSCVDSDANIIKFAKTIFIKNSFKESQIDNCVFNNLFRVNETVGQKSILINYLANIFATNRVDIIDGKNMIRETIAFDFDINTFADEAYTFDTASVKAFFSRAAELCMSFLNFYFKD